MSYRRSTIATRLRHRRSTGYTSGVWQLGPDWSDERRLAGAWRAALPFPHLVFDEFVPPAALPELLAILDDEPVERYQSDLFAFDATAPEPTTAAFRDLRS